MRRLVKLGLGHGFHQVVLFSPLLTTGQLKLILNMTGTVTIIEIPTTIQTTVYRVSLIPS